MIDDFGKVNVRETRKHFFCTKQEIYFFSPKVFLFQNKNLKIIKHTFI